jgi:hypothetical protein
MKTYKYDIAISLCKQDIAFARDLVKAFNPGLKIFFYEDKQQELVSKCGPEAFAKAFKEEARVVVILSRKEWSETFYTEIERNAIIDRTSIKGEGYNFLLVLPMEPGQAPTWYPATMIYVDPRNYTIEQIARFVEFKVTEQGGAIKPITFEERMINLQENLDNKKKHNRYLCSTESVKEAEGETKKLIELFNQKIDIIQNQGLHLTIIPNKISESLNYSRDEFYGEMGIEDIRLQMSISVDVPFRVNIRTSQGYVIKFFLYKQPNVNEKPNVIASALYRYNKTNEHNFGWSAEQQYQITGLHDRNIAYVIQDSVNKYYYDLREIITSEALVEYWFTELFKLVEDKFKPVLL